MLEITAFSQEDADANTNTGHNKKFDSWPIAWPLEDAIHIFIITSIAIVWTILLTFLPVLVGDIETDTDSMYIKKGWYSLADILRFIEPMGGILFNTYIVLKSGIAVRTDAIMLLMVFSFGSSLYIQGAGFHSASVMYKHAVEEYDERYGGNRYITDMLYWIRTIWQHIIAHYIYAVGYGIYVACIAYVYRDHELDIQNASSSSMRTFYIAISISTISFGILASGVAIDFPSGTIVGLIYFVLYGICGIGCLLHRSHCWSLLRNEQDKLDVCLNTFIKLLHKRPILIYYFLSYGFGLIILVCWLITVGGFHSLHEAK